MYLKDMGTIADDLLATQKFTDTDETNYSYLINKKIYDIYGEADGNKVKLCMDFTLQVNKLTYLLLDVMTSELFTTNVIKRILLFQQQDIPLYYKNNINNMYKNTTEYIMAYISQVRNHETRVTDLVLNAIVTGNNFTSMDTEKTLIEKIKGSDVLLTPHILPLLLCTHIANGNHAFKRTFNEDIYIGAVMVNGVEEHKNGNTAYGYSYVLASKQSGDNAWYTPTGYKVFTDNDLERYLEVQ